MSLIDPPYSICISFSQEPVNIQRIVFAFLAWHELIPELQIKPTTAAVS